MTLLGKAAQAFLLLAVAASAAAAEVQRSEHMQARKGYFREHCIELKAGQSLWFKLVTPHPVDFNIHHHADPKTLYLVRQRVSSSLEKQQTITVGGEYCFMWANTEDNPSDYPITLTYDFH